MTGHTPDETGRRRAAVLDRTDDWDGTCDWDGCTREATTAFRFHGQAGHVHDCTAHAATVREHCDVAESSPLPCPWPHNGETWTAAPKALS